MLKIGIQGFDGYTKTHLLGIYKLNIFHSLLNIMKYK